MNARDRKAFEEYWMSDMNSSTTNRAAMLGAEWGIKYARREMKRRIEEMIGKQTLGGMCSICTNRRNTKACYAGIADNSEDTRCNFKLRLRGGAR